MREQDVIHSQASFRCIATRLWTLWWSDECQNRLSRGVAQCSEDFHWDIVSAAETPNGSWIQLDSGPHQAMYLECRRANDLVTPIFQ
jgi:hypothetical protein